MTTSKNTRYFHAEFDADQDIELVPETSQSGLKMHHKDKPVGKWKKKMKKVLSPLEKRKLSKEKAESRKKKRAKKGRLIIRNLAFTVNEEELKTMLSKFGSVIDVTIPKKPNGRKRGFAFAQFEQFNSSIQAIKHLNFKEVHGRPIAIDYAIAKSNYDHVISSRKVTQEVESDEQDNETDDDDDGPPLDADNSEVDGDITEEKADENVIKNEDRVSKFMKELEFNADSEDEDDAEKSSSGSSDSEDENEDEENDKNQNLDRTNEDDNKSKSKRTAEHSRKTSPVKGSKKPGDDIQEGRTVFIRNISFDTTEEDLKEAMEEFGPVEYSVLCYDKATDHPKGTAFVKFQNKEDAAKVIEQSNSEEGFYSCGRRIFCNHAMSREEIRQKFGENQKEKKDKRNLRLLREGLIMENSEEAKGVSPTDLAKRKKLEMMKKQKLKNLNFFVSDKRLCVHNLPNDFTDKQLRELFLKSVGKGAIITEARIMKEFNKVDANGQPKSKGFGFVAFAVHEQALKALHAVNNNPSIFTPQKRPIVEFSVESHLALLKKERRREKTRLKNMKRKEQAGGTEENQVNKKRNNGTVKKAQGKAQRRFSKTPQKNVSSSKNPSDSKGKKMVQKGQKKKPLKDDKAFSNLVQHYKGKLLNKLK